MAGPRQNHSKLRLYSRVVVCHKTRGLLHARTFHILLEREESSHKLSGAKKESLKESTNQYRMFTVYVPPRFSVDSAYYLFAFCGPRNRLNSHSLPVTPKVAGAPKHKVHTTRERENSQQRPRAAGQGLQPPTRGPFSILVERARSCERVWSERRVVTNLLERKKSL